MIENQLEQTLKLINLHVKLQERLSMQLFKANALITVTLSEDFLKHSASVIYSYLWTLNDVVEQAKVLSERIFNELKKNKLPDTIAEAALKEYLSQNAESELSSSF